ncbi:MAG: excinuclease ABC subunit UvrA [Mariprofundales bacterium]
MTINNAHKIRVRGARVHNLKDISLDIPRDQLVVITGVSGSGKSSLAFDTLYAEGQRRYVESLSSYARQFLGMMERPDVDSIEGLSPAISIEQKTTSRNPRSTVGTVTEIHDYLRLLFARIGKPHCPECGKIVRSQPASAIIDDLSLLPDGCRLQLLAPIARNRKGTFRRELEQAERGGFVRALVDGEIYAIEDIPDLERNKKHDIALVVDRLVLREGIRVRLADSVETTLRQGQGLLIAMITNSNGEEEQRLFSELFSCPECNVSLPNIEPRLFSFNSPAGACPVCDGLGTRTVFDPDLVVPDTNKSLHDGAIQPWSPKQTPFFRETIQAVADFLDIDTRQPYNTLSEQARHIILYGSGKDKLTFKFHGDRAIYKPFEGVIPHLKRRLNESQDERVREDFSAYINTIACKECAGSRLNASARHVLVADKNLPQVNSMPLREAQLWVAALPDTLSKQHLDIAQRVIDEVHARLGFMIEVGLNYLTLGRTAGTLSGGEAQRIRLATQIGSALVGVLYILDEPSIGLHQRDNNRLLATLEKLRDLGNSVLVVEHDEDTVRRADWVIDMGPKAGEHGGEVVAAGSIADILKSEQSLTADYLSGRLSIPVPKWRNIDAEHPILSIAGVQTNNLQNVTANIPLERFVCVTGVSGSGKSSLIMDTLYPALRGLKSGKQAGIFSALHGAEQIKKVVEIDQSPIGRTPRSNPATYTGLFTPMRELFAMTNEARSRGYKPGRFSFNVRGGRCEACQGDGVIKVEMHFLPDVYVHCETCNGARYNRETLDVHYRGKNIAQVLAMTVEEAAEFFINIPKINLRLQTLLKVGLGYIRLGQSATTLSGGEAQRVKLAKELARRNTGNTMYILDEPTTGLHIDDVAQLLRVLHALVDQGNSIVVIEHHLDVIKTADWVIDLGPEGGDCGGEIIMQAPPTNLAACKESHTGRYLQSFV